MSELFGASPFMIPAFVLALAFLLDLAIGDPRWLPHPVRLMGRLADQSETWIRPFLTSPRLEFWGGVIFVTAIVGTAFFFGVLFLKLIHLLLPLFTIWSFLAAVILVYLTATTLALRELINAARQVAGLLKEGHLASARKELSMVVGRDTQNLSEKEVLQAVIETLSENLSDGVIAPLFYLALGGLPLALAYKAINTLDSMVGYKNARYRHFGWAAARLDDLANYLPARITGLLIVMSTGLLFHSWSHLASSWQTMIADGRKHASPNAGLPEAAMAGALGVRLGGPACYGGVPVEKPYLGREKVKDYFAAAEKAQDIVLVSSFIGVCAGMSAVFWRG